MERSEYSGLNDGKYCIERQCHNGILIGDIQHACKEVVLRNTVVIKEILITQVVDTKSFLPEELAIDYVPIPVPLNYGTLKDRDQEEEDKE